jgi:hypothetical protein
MKSHKHYVVNWDIQWLIVIKLMKLNLLKKLTKIQ